MLAHNWLMNSGASNGMVGVHSPPAPTSATLVDERLRFWQSQDANLSRMPLSEWSSCVDTLRKNIEGVKALANAYEREHKVACFGTPTLYSRVMDVVVGEMARMILSKHAAATRKSVDEVTVQVLEKVENAVLVTGRAAAVAEAGHYGALRHLVGVGEHPTLRWLWGTVLALLWVFAMGASQGEFSAVATHIHDHVGNDEFRLFGAILIALHRLFGILPPPLYARLTHYFAA